MSFNKENIDINEIKLLGESIKEAVSIKEKTVKKISDVYVFVSFDLVNSTKLKYQYQNWLGLVKRFIDASNKDWDGIHFWKFNGDEILFYAKIVSLNQLSKLLRTVYSRSKALTNELKQLLLSDNKSNNAEDLVGLKTSIWTACVSDDENSLNSRLDHIDSIDFAGINMDEGFRMSKCAIQNKIIVDPKIVLLFCLLDQKKFSLEKWRDRKSNNSGTETNIQRNNLTLDEKFDLFYYRDLPDKFEDSDENALIKKCAENFRIVGYEKCKGVWGERNYPIIWFSTDWKTTIDSIKYDERYLEEAVCSKFIEKNYLGVDDNNKHSDINTKLLRKIYDDVAVYRQAIDKMLLDSNFQVYSKAELDIQIDSRSYIYYSIVCIHPETKGVLAFLRSEHRGHLPNTWDFDQQKNAQRISGEDVITQIQDKFKTNFGISIEVVKDEKRNSLIPMDIHPIYRRGKLHNGILCFAYITDEFSENEILNKIKGKKLDSVVSGDGCKLYSDVAFIHPEQLNEDGKGFKLNDSVICELTYDDALMDSNTWNNHKKGREVGCTTNFSLTVAEAAGYRKK